MESVLYACCYLMLHCEGRGLDRVSNEEAHTTLRNTAAGNWEKGKIPFGGFVWGL